MRRHESNLKKNNIFKLNGIIFVLFYECLHFVLLSFILLFGHLGKGWWGTKDLKEIINLNISKKI